MKKRILAIFLSGLLACSMLAACGTSAQPAPAEPSSTAAEGGFGSDESNGEPTMGGEAVVGLLQDLGDSLDPYHLTAAGSREVMFNVFEGLVKPNADGEFIPAVASEFELSEDGLTYTFTLREGVKFHTGDPVTAADVLHSYETCAATTDQAALAEALAQVTSVEASEAGDQVTITLKESNPDFLSYASMVYIVPAGYTNQATSPVGTGPYRFGSRSVQENMILEKFEDYWGDPAYLDMVILQIYEDSNALVSALGAGAVDLVSHLTIDQAEAADPEEYKTLEGTMNLVQALYLNNAVEPFNSEMVRKAMCYAIDVQEILDLTSDGHGARVGTSMYPAFVKYFDEELAEYYEPDIDIAKSMLEEAGYGDGFSMSITVPSNYTPHVRVAEVLVEQLRQVGIKAKIQPVEWETWLSDVYTGREFESTVIGFDAATLSAGAMLNRWMSDNGTNMINYNNPDYDRVMAEANACTDPDQQTELYKQAAKILTETAANVYIQDMADFVVIKNYITGYQFYPLYVLDLAKLHYVGEPGGSGDEE